MFNIKVHPALKPVVYSSTEEHAASANEEQKHHELNTINFYKHRIDRNSMRVLSLALPASPNIHTLKYLMSDLIHR